MAAAIFRVNYINGQPDLYDLNNSGNVEDDGWSYWVEGGEEVTSPNQEQVLMHIEHANPVYIEQMKSDPKYTFIEDIIPEPE